MNKYFTYKIKGITDKNYTSIIQLINNNIFVFFQKSIHNEYITFYVNNDIPRKLKLKILNNIYINNEEKRILKIISKSISGIRLEVNCGSNFTDVSKEAKVFANVNNIICSFNFNGINCIVDKNTNLDNLYKYYNDAHLMKWDKIGPICDEEYDEETKIEYQNQLKLSKERLIKRRISDHKKEVEEKNNYINKIKDINIELLEQKLWYDWKLKNTDSYGKCVFEYAEGWAKLMQSEAKSKNKKIDIELLKEIANKTSFEMGFLGVSGSMHYAAQSILIQCWKYGNLLKEWSEIKN